MLNIGDPPASSCFRLCSTIEVSTQYGLMMKSPGCQLIRLSLDPTRARKLSVLAEEADFVIAKEFQHIALPDINLGHGRPGEPKALSWNLATKLGKAQMHFCFTKLALP
jgi:hypothetical protein